MSLLSGLDLGFQIENISILKGIDIEVNGGEMVGLIGPNGAGKSTLLRLLTCVEKACSGEIFYGEINVRQISAEQRARFIGYLVQTAQAYWPLSVEKAVGLGRIPHQKWWQHSSREDQEKIYQAMQVTETLAYRNRIVSTLSGGEHTLVMLARIFATDPQIIFADEPVAALDPYHQLHVMEILRNHSNNDRAAVVVLHDLSLASRFCDRLYIINHGELYESGAPDKIMTAENIAKVYGVETKIVHDAEGVSVMPVSRLEDHHP
ncbi:MAG: ABC transporter ATP-binding protein [Gammaproteobacteria bacterium]|nr:ABC transporter ATP-binding protein [Gammaproteobacteria bacterium]